MIIFALLLIFILVWFFFSGPKISYASKQIISDVIKNDLPELVKGETGTVTNKDYEVWYERIVPNNKPCDTIMFLFGAGGSALEWPNCFLQKFVDAGFQVIRFDQRDTGLSKSLMPGNHMYTLDELAQDAVAVLEKQGIEKAHIVGLSMGGMVAQEMAIQFPLKVKSLTLLMTSGDVTAADLPSLKSSYFFKQLFRGLPLLKYRLFGGEANLIKERIAKMMLLMNESDINVKEVAEMALYALRYRKGVSIKGSVKHQKIVAGSKPRYSRPSEINIPTLVVHGTNDPILPIEHGKRLAEVIKDARELWLEGAGHMFPFPDMEDFTYKLLEFLTEPKETST
jgi:pimeloyl-ACP methyl ester carboxylesterase